MSDQFDRDEMLARVVGRGENIKRGRRLRLLGIVASSLALIVVVGAVTLLPRDDVRQVAPLATEPRAATPTPTPEITPPPTASPDGPTGQPSPAPTESADPSPTSVPAPEPFEIPPDGVALPTYETDGGPSNLLVDGKITGDAELGCVWIVHKTGHRQAVLWRPGHWARFHPLRVYDEAGEQVWQEDEFRDYGGYSSEDHVDRVPEQCRVGGPAFLVLDPQPAEMYPGRRPPDGSPNPDPTPSP